MANRTRGLLAQPDTPQGGPPFGARDPNNAGFRAPFPAFDSAPGVPALSRPRAAAGTRKPSRAEPRGAPPPCPAAGAPRVQPPAPGPPLPSGSSCDGLVVALAAMATPEGGLRPVATDGDFKRARLRLAALPNPADPTNRKPSRVPGRCSLDAAFQTSILPKEQFY